MAIQRVRPEFVATNIITGEDRTPRVVLEANRDHNSGRTARLEQVVFVNDLSPAEALDAVCDREGEIDIVTEVSPADARRVLDSQFARLVTIDANRMLTGVFNTYEVNDAPLQDVRMREALNWAVDRHRIVEEAFAGYATPLAALTPTWCNGAVAELEPRRRDPARAKELADAVGWPEGRALRIAADASLEGIARMISADVQDALGIASEIIAVPADEIVGGHGRSSRRSCCRPGTSCSTRGLTCRQTTRQRSCIESSSATTAPSVPVHRTRNSTGSSRSSSARSTSTGRGR
jgi:peptide/nickel transport system substrate-binding protein